jgi:hypothetical protein
MSSTSDRSVVANSAADAAAAAASRAGVSDGPYTGTRRAGTGGCGW